MLVCASALQTHTLSTRGTGDGLAVHADIDRATGSADEASPACGQPIDIAHIAIGRIRVLVELVNMLMLYGIAGHTVKKLNLSKKVPLWP